MKLFVVLLLLLIGCACQAQQLEKPQVKPVPKWKLDKNKLITGGLVLVAGSAKGFNETLVFHYKVFKAKFPNANHEWFDPRLSWKNKYEDRNPDMGPKFPLSTTVLCVYYRPISFEPIHWKVCFPDRIGCQNRRWEKTVPSLPV
jgi:hypothetical protein